MKWSYLNAIELESALTKPIDKLYAIYMKYKDLDVLQKPQKTTDRPIPTTEKILEKYKEEYGEFQVRMNPLISKHLPVTPCCSCRRLQPKHVLSDIKRIKKPTFNSTYCTTIHSIQF